MARSILTFSNGFYAIFKRNFQRKSKILIAEAQEQVTANLANFSYDPLNFTYLTDAKAVDLFINLLGSPNEKLVLHGIAGLCNICLGKQCGTYAFPIKTASSQEIHVRFFFCRRSDQFRDDTQPRWHRPDFGIIASSLESDRRELHFNADPIGAGRHIRADLFDVERGQNRRPQAIHLSGYA